MSPENSRRGVDGWASSDIHAKTEAASSADEQKALYAQWASSYDDEMNANDLASYKSVVSVALPHIFAHLSTGDAQAHACTYGEEIAALDAGCGTGLLGAHLSECFTREAAIEAERGASATVRTIVLSGCDLSPDMLDLAGKKGVFSGELKEADLHKPLPFDENNFDLVVSTGCFLPGHCGPEAVPNLLNVLRPGGHAVFTVREAMFKDQEVAFKAAIAESKCTLLQADLMPYYGEIDANVLVVLKDK